MGDGFLGILSDLFPCFGAVRSGAPIPDLPLTLHFLVFEMTPLKLTTQS